jgi:hypothetical protein
MFAAKDLLLTSNLPIIFDAVGGGNFNNQSFSESATATWSHTAKGPVFGSASGGGSAGPVTFSMTYGGVSMTQLIINAFDTGGTTQFVSIAWFYLANPAAGSQTVTATVNTTSIGCGVQANTVSYLNVLGHGTAVQSSGSGTSLSQTPGSSAPLWIQAFCSHDGTLSAYNQTLRDSMPSASGSNPVYIGDASGSPSFTATNSTSVAWGSVAVPLLG